MEFRQLECFIAVVEEGGFSRATTRLHMTQPAISYQIKLLESDLELDLFFRRSRGVTLTEAGRVLYDQAQMIQNQVRLARHALERLSDDAAGEVRIGTVNSVGIYFLPKILNTMRLSHPSAKPTVLYRNSFEIMYALLANKVDLALVANPQADRRLSLETILEENISLVSGSDSQFYGRETVLPDELQGQPFATLTTENPTGQMVRDYLAKLGVSIETVVSTDHVETVRQMVEAGVGIAFLPDMVSARGIPCKGQPLGPFTRARVQPSLTRKIALVTWKNFEPTPAVEAFILELRAFSKRWKNCTDVAKS
jgi:LysR family hydrogen peroxide-inducible transcriptional activator